MTIHIYGDIRSDEYPKYSFDIKEKNNKFIKREDGIYRLNEIYREVVDRKTGNLIRLEKLFSNDCLIKYEIDESMISKTES